MNGKEIKVISSNRKAYHEFTISDKWEAGIVLQGTEVKALRDGRVNLSEGWVDITERGEAILRDVHIGHYSHGNLMNHAEQRPRRLLLHARELRVLARSIQEKGFSILPLAIYFQGSLVKLEIGLGKGKKSYDKREASKEKDARKQMAQALKGARR